MGENRQVYTRKKQERTGKCAKQKDGRERANVHKKKMERTGKCVPEKHGREQANVHKKKMGENAQACTRKRWERTLKCAQKKRWKGADKCAQEKDGREQTSTPTHLVWLQRYQWYRKYWSDKDYLEHSNSVFHKTLKFMMVYHQTKYGCKRTSNSGDTVNITETVTFWLYEPLLWSWPWS